MCVSSPDTNITRLGRSNVLPLPSNHIERKRVVRTRTHPCEKDEAKAKANSEAEPNPFQFLTTIAMNWRRVGQSASAPTDPCVDAPFYFVRVKVVILLFIKFSKTTTHPPSLPPPLDGSYLDS